MITLIHMFYQRRYELRLPSNMEIRYLSLLSRAFLEEYAYWADLTNVVLFESWTDFEIQAHSDCRNICVHGDRSQAHLRLRVDSLLRLIEEKDNVSAEGVANTLRDIALPEIEDDLRAAYDNAESLSLKSHLRKAIDRCMNRLDF